MIGHLAVGIGTTQARTRINTLFVPALFFGRTIRVDDTLRPAGHVRVAKVLRYALAGRSTISL